jgi:tRNA 2-thiocytidine biosynthesis protein TtcA
MAGARCTRRYRNHACALCSRLRHGTLYRLTRDEKCSAVVLGDQRGDILAPIFVNLFHGGRLATMPPKRVHANGNLFVYRPIAFVAETDCDAFCATVNGPIIPCDLCGSQEGPQRAQINPMIDRWEARLPGHRNIKFRALINAQPAHLADPTLFDLRGLAMAPAAFASNPLQPDGED